MPKSVTRTYSRYTKEATKLERKLTAQELAALVGVKLFDAETSSLAGHIKQAEDKLALLQPCANQ